MEDVSFFPSVVGCHNENMIKNQVRRARAFSLFGEVVVAIAYMSTRVSTLRSGHA